MTIRSLNIILSLTLINHFSRWLGFAADLGWRRPWWVFQDLSPCTILQTFHHFPNFSPFCTLFTILQTFHHLRNFSPFCTLCKQRGNFMFNSGLKTQGGPDGCKINGRHQTRARKCCNGLKIFLWHYIVALLCCWTWYMFRGECLVHYLASFCTTLHHFALLCTLCTIMHYLALFCTLCSI